MENNGTNSAAASMTAGPSGSATPSVLAAASAPGTKLKLTFGGNSSGVTPRADGPSTDASVSGGVGQYTNGDAVDGTEVGE